MVSVYFISHSFASNDRVPQHGGLLIDSARLHKYSESWGVEVEYQVDVFLSTNPSCLICVYYIHSALGLIKDYAIRSILLPLLLVPTA